MSHLYDERSILNQRKNDYVLYSLDLVSFDDNSTFVIQLEALICELNTFVESTKVCDLHFSSLCLQ